MLDHRDIQKFIKPTLTAFILKAILFVAILVFLIANNLVGFSSDQWVVSHCDPYLNLKNSRYRNATLSAQFMLAVLGSFGSMLSLVVFVHFLVVLRKEQKQKLNSRKRFSQNRLRFHFILSFIETVYIINIFSRAVQRLTQQSSCSISNKIHSIVLLLLSLLVLCTLSISNFIWFKLLSLIKTKIKSLQQFSLYSDQMTLHQNLIFNKSGYIKQLLKAENYSSQSTVLKDQLIKSFPSGYKKNNSTANRQIIYKLRGGNKNNTAQNKRKDGIKNKDDFQIQFQLNQDISSNKNATQVHTSNPKENTKSSNLLSVSNKTFDHNPNDQNYQRVHLSQKVIQLSFHKKLEPFKGQKQSSSNDDEQNQNGTQKGQTSNPFLKMIKVPNNQIQNQLNSPNFPKKLKKVPSQNRQEEQLQQKFNLSPDLENRKKYQNKKNVQNIDENGNYYFVDTDKIRRKSKYLKYNTIVEETPSAQVQTDISHINKNWIPKQKRQAKKHEKMVKQYLKNLQKIRKQQILLQQDKSEYSESFQKSELSSQMSNYSSYQSSEYQQKDNQQQIQGQQNGQQTVPQTKSKRKRKPQLYLYMKRKKVTGAQNKLKLFQDEEGFYDDQGQNSESKASQNSNIQGEHRIDSNQAHDKAIAKQHFNQKNKNEDKRNFQNKVLQTQEARILRLIRKKYIEKSFVKKQNNQNQIVFVEPQESKVTNQNPALQLQYL